MLREMFGRFTARLVTVLVSLGILASMAWGIWAMVTERAVIGWLDARAEEGWLVNYEELSVRGYPIAFRTEFTSLELADPDTGWLWTLPAFQLESEAFRPDQIRAVWPDEQGLASPLERLTIRSEEITSVLDVRPGANFALDASDTSLTNVSVQSEAGWVMTLPEGRTTMTRLDGTDDAAYEVEFAARGLSLPTSMRAELDPASILPDVIETLSYRADMSFDRPWDLRAVEERRPQLTAIEVREMSAIWGGLVLRVAGEFEVDADGIPDGDLTLRAENWRQMVALAVRSGVLPSQLQQTVEGILGIVAGLDGDPEVIDAELRFSGGRAFLGPLPLGPAPRFVLP